MDRHGRSVAAGRLSYDINRDFVAHAGEQLEAQAAGVSEVGDAADVVEGVLDDLATSVRRRD
jgi:hypothetical protein